MYMSGNLFLTYHMITPSELHMILHRPVSYCIIRSISFLFPGWLAVSIIGIVTSSISRIHIMRLESAGCSCICRTSQTSELLSVTPGASIPVRIVRFLPLSP